MTDACHVRLDGLPGPWNFTGGRPLLILGCAGVNGPAHLWDHHGFARTWPDPLAALAWMATYPVDLPNARWVGFLSYDLGRLFETLPNRAADDLETPLYAFALVRPDPDGWPTAITDPVDAELLGGNFTRDEYEAAVARVVDYVAAGDVFQVNLSQRFTARSAVRPIDLYARLQRQAPAWYGACLDFGEFALVSNSPELFLEVTAARDGRRTVTTRPIKGTRPRRPGMDAELLASAKDQAELNMIIDLERNDLGRVCEIGSVRVTQPRTIEAHPTVYHGAATVRGTLRPGVSFVDLLRATFPGGSITGAPKIRAMEIIDELEPTRRGAYCGAIGYFDPADGSMQFNVAIRTMTLKDGLIHIPVGGGIVADSIPSAEYEETLVKAQAMFRALGIEIE